MGRLTESGDRFLTESGDRFLLEGDTGGGGGGGGGGDFGAYSDVVLEDSPLIYWRLDEPSGTTAADSSGNGNDGTYFESPILGAAGLLVGDADTAVVFDVTSSQRVELADTLSPGTLGAFSVECIADVAWDVGPGTFLLLHTDDDATGVQIGYSAGGVFLDFFDADDFLNVGTADVVDSGPHHVAGVWNGTSLLIYLDGHLVGDSGLLGSDGPTFLAAYTLAAGGFAPSDSADGTIDEVALYTHALSPVRVQVHAFVAGYGDEPATVSDVAPSVVPTGGGTALTIAGTGFTDATDVIFGDVSAASFNVDDDTQISAVTPAHDAGTFTVAVVKP